jgi:hypothetical protein
MAARGKHQCTKTWRSSELRFPRRVAASFNERQEPNVIVQALVRLLGRKLLSNCVTPVTMMKAPTKGNSMTLPQSGDSIGPWHGTIVIEGSVWT